MTTVQGVWPQSRVITDKNPIARPKTKSSLRSVIKNEELSKFRKFAPSTSEIELSNATTVL